MSAPKYPPGPWIVQPLPTRVGYPNWRPFAIRCKATNVHVATVGNVDRFYEGEAQEAAAHLIAAAPTAHALLLEVAAYFVEHRNANDDGSPCLCSQCDLARRVRAHVRGERAP